MNKSPKVRKEKTFRPRARRPRGLEDRFAEEVTAQRAMLERICDVYERHGFEPLETPALEYADALGSFLPDQDRPNEGVFGLQDDDEQWLALRYDLTAPLARLVAERFDSLPKPFRRYQMGPVWRNEKPGPGRFREFWQCDADTVGTPLMAADAEMAAMLADCMEEVGIPRGDYVVRVNNRKILNGVLERIGVLNADDPFAEARRLTVLRAIDKLDRLGPEGVRLLLGPGRKDESGDVTDGAGLSPEQVDMVMAFTAAGGGGRSQVMAGLQDLVANSPAGREGIEELEQIGATLDALGYTDDRVTFDPSIVRGLGYYTGPVFEADLTFEITDEKGRPVRFGSVASGGRYDDLVKRFKGVSVPATGCSIGVSRLLSALKALDRLGDTQARGPVVVLTMDRERLPEYARMAQQLRTGGVRAEVYLGGGGMKAQLKYADKRGAPVAVIQGEDERARGEVTLKDLALGAEMAAAIADNRVWREEQPAQISVAADSLVSGVKEILARRRDG